MVVLLFTLRVRDSLWIPGLLVAGAGQALRIWAAGTISKHQALTEAGPYAFSRNPLYVGTVLMAYGLTLAMRDALLFFLIIPPLCLYYVLLVRTEERALESRFGEAYRSYLEATPRWLGLPGKERVPASGRFLWRQVLKNREQWVALRSAAVVLWLFLVSLWRSVL